MSCLIAQCERLENGMREIKSSMSDLKTQLENLDHRIFGRSVSSCASRTRFISAAKRDIFRTATHEDHAIIAARTIFGIPDFGYAKFDARLYRKGGRRDFPAFRRLYGLHPDDVHLIGEILLFCFVV